MITILINTKNIYTRYAIKQLMQESVAHEENLIFVDSYTPGNIAEAQIIFTEMAPGEIFLCHDELKYKTTRKAYYLFFRKGKINVRKMNSPTVLKIVCFYIKVIRFRR